MLSGILFDRGHHRQIARKTQRQSNLNKTASSVSKVKSFEIQTVLKQSEPPNVRIFF